MVASMDALVDRPAGAALGRGVNVAVIALEEDGASPITAIRHGIALNDHFFRPGFIRHFIRQQTNRRFSRRPKHLILLVGVAGFEPATPSSRTGALPDRRRLSGATLTRGTPLSWRSAVSALSRPFGNWR